MPPKTGATGPTYTPPAEVLDYEGKKYKDGSELAFGGNVKYETNRDNWKTTMDKKIQLWNVLIRAIAKRDELRKQQSKEKIVTDPVETKITDGDCDLNAAGQMLS